MTGVRLQGVGFRTAAPPPTPPPPPPGTWMCALSIDGTEVLGLDTLFTDDLTAFHFGAPPYPGVLDDYRLDNLIVGTTVGGSDIFSDDFSGATIAPPFDSVVDLGGITIDAATLYLNANPSVSQYAVGSLPAGIDAVYFQFDVYFNTAMDVQDASDLLNVLSGAATYPADLAVGTWASINTTGSWTPGWNLEGALASSPGVALPVPLETTITVALALTR